MNLHLLLGGSDREVVVVRVDNRCHLSHKISVRVVRMSVVMDEEVPGLHTCIAEDLLIATL